jgi:hypothetical protein
MSAYDFLFMRVVSLPVFLFSNFISWKCRWSMVRSNKHIALSIFNNLLFDIVVLMYAFVNPLKLFQIGFALASHASPYLSFILIDRALMLGSWTCLLCLLSLLAEVLFLDHYNIILFSFSSHELNLTLIVLIIFLLF